jgi:hypothetical protein
MIRVDINDRTVPKAFRKKAKQISRLLANNDIAKLKELRDSSKTFGIYIYHHSQGTDSYFDDIAGKYLTWDQVVARDAEKLNNGEHFATVVIPYKAGIIFIKGSLSPNPSLN